jgi:hypothetical protein
MGPMYVRQDRLAQASTVSIALFVDAGYVRRCAARSHQLISGSAISASRVSIDAGEISRFLDSLIVDFELGGSRGRGGRRPGRRIYDTIGADRRQRSRQLHYRSALRAERFVVRTVRPPRQPGAGMVAEGRDRSGVVEAALADDLVSLGGELTTVVLLAGGERPARAVWTAREQGAEVVLVIPASSSALVGERLREAATREITLHPEVFEALFAVRDSGWRQRAARASVSPADVGAAR